VKRVFVTSASYGGALGGLDGGDARCQGLANDAGLQGTFAAWLSDGTVATAPAMRLTHFAGPYVLVNGARVANTWADLIDGTIGTGGIDRTQTGQQIFASGVWTNTDPYGLVPGGVNANNHCNRWSTDAGAANGSQGLSNTAAMQWTQNGAGTPCNGSARLYCFEQ